MHTRWPKTDKGTVHAAPSPACINSAHERAAVEGNCGTQTGESLNHPPSDDQSKATATVSQKLESAGRGAVSGLLQIVLCLLCRLKPQSATATSQAPAAGAAVKTVRFSSEPARVMHFSQGSTEQLEYWRCGRHRYCKRWDHSVFRASLKLRGRPARHSMLHQQPRKSGWSLQQLINYLQYTVASLQNY